MSEKNTQILRLEYTKEGLVQQLALMRMSEDDKKIVSTNCFADKFKDYCDQIRATIHDE